MDTISTPSINLPPQSHAQFLDNQIEHLKPSNFSMAISLANYISIYHWCVDEFSTGDGKMMG